ncbi:hypothetical protein CQW29_12250 [Pantoea coffeiphila]|uniref:Uncharacterized protein n=1 Tax=Pantoea coffeiphila TaxID=1465635 RepID=A0A2S9IBQ1_9GAMM|nr:hypothetical protein CQW29_12250 [Pantoea coffeiphila]
MHFTSQYMSIKPLFLNMWPEHVYGIDTSGRYVDKTRFFKHDDKTGWTYYKRPLIVIFFVINQ